MTYQKNFMQNGLTLVTIEKNLVDMTWNGMLSTVPRESRPSNSIEIHEMRFSGKLLTSKINEIRSEMSGKADMAVINALDEVAWLFNLRGSDIPYNPFFFAYGIIEQSTVTLYIDKPSRLLDDSAIRTHLKTSADGSCSVTDCVTVKNYAAFYAELRSKARRTSGKVWVSPMSSYSILNALGATETIAMQKAHLKPSKVRSIKGVKNAVEIAGMRRAQVRDAAAVAEFISLLEEEVNNFHFVSLQQSAMYSTGSFTDKKWKTMD